MQHYVPMRDGKLGDWFTDYYDPIIDYNHKITLRDGGAESAIWGNLDKLLMVLSLGVQRRDVGRQFYDSAVAGYEWDTLKPADEPIGDPRGTLYGLAFARDFGDEAVDAKLTELAEAQHEPTFDEETGEFHWAFGLGESRPRGQFNASAAMAEMMTEGAWWRLFNEPNYRKFVDPTVHGVDFPTVCLSQATYDATRRLLVVSTDAGVPAARGKATTFRVSNVNPQRCSVIADGTVSDAWRAVDGDIEIATTVGEHTFLVRDDG